MGNLFKSLGYYSVYRKGIILTFNTDKLLYKYINRLEAEQTMKSDTLFSTGWNGEWFYNTYPRMRIL